jgi:hypothetical protein
MYLVTLKYYKYSLIYLLFFIIPHFQYLVIYSSLVLILLLSLDPDKRKKKSKGSIDFVKEKKRKRKKRWILLKLPNLRLY